MRELIQNLKEKKCTNCKDMKDLNRFYFRINKKTETKYYQASCMECQNLYDYKTDKNHKLKKAYGITLDDYNKLLSKQKNKCSICEIDNNGKYRNKTRAFAVDHCHITNKIRGLLCSDCNVALGLLKDNTIYLQSAIKYLNKLKN